MTGTRSRPAAFATALVALVVMCAAAVPVPLDAAGGQGQTHLQGHALADDGGPFLALGASLFWALWGERHDASRFDANLAWLAARGVDYVRILGMVGGRSWEDRIIDPDDEAYWPTVDRLIERVGRHGLRLQVTLFAEADTMMPEPDRRRAFADGWADRANRHPERLMLLEVANEHWQNGVPDVAELRALGRRLAERTTTLVALSAPYPGQICDVYAGSAADVATIHYGRSSDGWASVRQPWEWPGEDLACRDALPVLVNNEPMGPQSSVEADDDPLRLIMSYVTTFLAGNAAYVLHAGAGVRGGGAADRALGRSTNFADTPGLDEALQGMTAAKDYLPGDLANWTRHDSGDAGLFRGLAQAAQDGAIGTAYAATSGERFVIVVFDVRRSIEATATGPFDVEVHDPLTGATIVHRELDTQEALRLDGAAAFILTGRRR